MFGRPSHIYFSDLDKDSFYCFVAIHFLDSLCGNRRFTQHSLSKVDHPRQIQERPDKSPVREKKALRVVLDSRVLFHARLFSLSQCANPQKIHVPHFRI